MVDVDVVVHLAGESVAGRWTKARRAAIRDSRVEGTRLLVEAMRQADRPPGCLVSASAIGYYGERGDDRLGEDEPPGDDFLADVCAGWEAAASRASEFGVRVVLCRLGIVLAAGAGAMAELWGPATLGLGGPLGTGRQWWSWIHLDDAVAAFKEACQREEMVGAYNVTAPSPERQKAFAQTLGRVVGRPSFLPAPAFALRAVLGGFSAELLSSRSVIPTRLLEQGFTFRHPDLEPALQAIQRVWP
jgi:hypothetical protein